MVLKVLKSIWLLMFAGRAFQVLGAEAEKALSPNVHLNLNEDPAAIPLSALSVMTSVCYVLQ